jgi:hypothetical protein
MTSLRRKVSVRHATFEASALFKVWARRVTSLILAALLACIIVPTEAWSQCPWDLIYTFDGQAEGDSLGYSVSGAGDADNDGYDDLIVGVPCHDYLGTNSGKAYVYSGRTGSMLCGFSGASDGDKFGYSVSRAGDVNSDGYDDVICAAPFYDDGGSSDAGRVYVYSPYNYIQLWVFTGETTDDQLGWSVSGAGDVNNDGHDDLIAGAPGNDGGGVDAGRAYVYSGQTGGLLWTFTGEAAGDRMGWSVSGAGDVDDDGYDDLVVGARYNDAGGPDAGRAYVYSGQTGGLLWTFTGEASGDRFGTSVSGAGDVNGDGYSDVIVGARNNDAGGSNAGRAYVYSGQTGGSLWTFTGEASSNFFGHAVSGAGDVDGDGYDDLIVSSPSHDAGGADAGRAYVYSGQTGGLLSAFDGEAAGDRMAWSVSGAGDVNNDGYDDLIVGACCHDAAGTDAGRAYVYSGHTGVMCFTGPTEGDRLGFSVSGAGDVNSDGYDDLIVGTPMHDYLGTNSGKAYVYSGQTGSLIIGYSGGSDDDMLGYSVSGAGDVNNDGYADVICAAPFYDDGANGDAGRVRVESPHDYVHLWTFTGDAPGDRLGHSVSGAGDVNNDGHDDLIVGAPYSDAMSSDGGRVYVYSGLSGTQLYGYTHGEAGGLFGYSVSGAGDVNNDGYDDFIIGHPLSDEAGVDAGRAGVVSGHNGLDVLHLFLGENAGDEFGRSVSGAGDVDDDGYDDLIVGAPHNDDAGGSAGRAYVYSGQTGDLLHTYPGQAIDDEFGHSVSGAGDVNNDGHDDLIVGAARYDAVGMNCGRAYVFCGQTGALLCIFTGEAAFDRMGYSVSGAGDVDNDGYDEVIVGAYGNDAGGDYAGRAYVFGCEVYATNLCGDVTGDGIVNLGDIVYLVTYLYKSGPAPDPVCVGDVTCDEIVNVGDVVYLVSYLYKAGPSPCPYCCIELIRSCQPLFGW